MRQLVNIMALAASIQERSKSMRSLAGLALVSLAAVGCNVTQEGAVGTVLFTPHDCGRAGGCDFRDSIGAGGQILVWIEGNDGVSTVGLDLVSSDPNVL